jgi:hypothetical protein
LEKIHRLLWVDTGLSVIMRMIASEGVAYKAWRNSMAVGRSGA